MTFKEKVLKLVSKIPKGKVLTYQEVARLAGESKAQRAVGNFMAQNQNPKIPCHRVIKNDFSTGSYNQGVQRKAYLLKKEGLKIQKRGKKFFILNH